MATITKTFHKTCLYFALVAFIAMGAFFMMTQSVYAQAANVGIYGLENNTWEQGTAKTIMWAPLATQYPVDVYLYFKSRRTNQWTYMRPIASGIPNSGQASVVMPTTDIFGDEEMEYKIAVGLNRGWSFNDSDSFKVVGMGNGTVIAQGSVTIPNFDVNDDRWEKGEEKLVEWTEDFIDPKPDKVGIYLYAWNGQRLQYLDNLTTSGGVTNDGAHKVTIPTVMPYGDASTNFKLIVISKDNEYHRIGSEYFKIEFEEGDEISSANITIDDLDNGEWEYGEEKKVRWNEDAFATDKVDIGLCGGGIDGCVTLKENTNNDNERADVTIEDLPSYIDANDLSNVYIAVREHSFMDAWLQNDRRRRSDEFDVIGMEEEETPTANVTIDDIRSGQWEYGTRKKVEWEEDAFGSRIDIAVCGKSASTCVILEDGIENEGEINLSMSGFAFSGRALTDRYLEVRNNRNLTSWFVQDPENQSEEFDIVDEESEEPSVSANAPRISFERGGFSRGREISTGRFLITFDVYNRDNEDIFIDKDLTYTTNYSYSPESAIMLYSSSGNSMPNEDEVGSSYIRSNEKDSRDTDEALVIRPGETREFYVDATFEVSESGSYYVKLNSLRWDTRGDEDRARNILTGSQLNDLKSLSGTLRVGREIIKPPVIRSVCPYTFTVNLRYGNYNAEVRKVQQFLNEKGYTVATSGAGSPGRETMSFGPATRAAVIRFQNDYYNEIVRTAGLTVANGVWGPASRAQANKMCSGQSSTSANIQIPALATDNNEWVYGESNGVTWNRGTFSNGGGQVDIALCGESWGDCVVLTNETNGTTNDGYYYLEMSGFNASSNFDAYLVMREHEEGNWDLSSRGAYSRSESFRVITEQQEEETPTVTVQEVSNGWYIGQPRTVTWTSGVTTDEEVALVLFRKESNNTWRYIQPLASNVTTSDLRYQVTMPSINLRNESDKYVVMIRGRRSNEFRILASEEDQEELEDIEDELPPNISIPNLENGNIWRSTDRHCVRWNPSYFSGEDVYVSLGYKYRIIDGISSVWTSRYLGIAERVEGFACYTLNLNDVPGSSTGEYRMSVRGATGAPQSSTPFYLLAKLSEQTEPSGSSGYSGYSNPEVIGLETEGSLDDIWTIGRTKSVKWDDHNINDGNGTVDIMLCDNNECFRYLDRNVTNDGLHGVTIHDSYSRSYYRIVVEEYRRRSLPHDYDTYNSTVWQAIKLRE